MTDDQRLAEIDRHVRELAELYDAVQVTGSWLTPEGRTKSHKRGSGNFYARLALCREFITEELAEDQATAIARKLEPPDDWGQSAATPATNP